MSVNPKRFNRFLSEQTHKNFAYRENEGEISRKDRPSAAEEFTVIPLEEVVPKKKNFLRQISSQAEQKIDRAEQQAQQIGEILQKPLFTRIISLQDEITDVNKSDVIINSSLPSYAIAETGLASHRDLKTGSQRFRWNLLFNLLVWVLVPLPFWIPFISNKLAIYLIPSIQAVFVLMWTVISLLALKNAFILYFNRHRDFSSQCLGLERKRIRHIVSISCYKEPQELIAQSVQTLANQSEVNRITMVIGFEEKTPDKEEKCRWLEEKFNKVGFERIIFTIHPKGLPNEIPGKCSNANYALRMAVAQMNLTEDDFDHILVTTCDADSKFPSNYISALTWKYLHDQSPSLSTIYQSPLFYNWKLDTLSSITRVTGLLRSLLMLGGLIPFNINTMSIFSFSLSLAKKGNFIHPSYQMDDIICLIRWMGVTQQRLKISMVPVPVLSGPTSGETVEKEVIEWVRQARRWTIGAAEVFHYFIIKSKRMPNRAAISWGLAFVIYYGVLLCTGGLYGLTSMVSMFVLVKNVPLIVQYIMWSLFALQMLSFAVAFLIDVFIPKLLNIDECICFLRNLFHYLLTPLILLFYSFVEFYALHEIVIFGKKVCKHGASDKSNLKG